MWLTIAFYISAVSIAVLVTGIGYISDQDFLSSLLTGSALGALGTYFLFKGVHQLILMLRRRKHKR
jgi:hypothetical protein